MDAEESDLPFRQVDGQMIGVFRHFVEYKFADEIGHRLVTDHAVRLKLDESIIEELFVV